MMTYRIALAISIMSAAILAPPSASSQILPDQTGSVKPAAVQVDPGDLPLTLTAGPVTGELTATSPKGLYTAGSSAFAQLTLSSKAESRRGVSAELLLEAEQGEIVDVDGSRVSTKQKGAVQLAHIDGIRKGRSRTVLIEVKLRAAADKSPNRLTLTLRAPGDDDDEDRPKRSAPASTVVEKTVALAWPVADCGGKFHAALRQIGDNGGARLREIWRNASRPDKSMSRGWLFRPSIPRRPGRRQNNEVETAGLSAREVRDIYIEADRLTSAGYDTTLRESGKYGWIIDKVALDLRRYFLQDMKPAICTGAIRFADYHDDQLSPLRKHGERLAELAGEAETLARAKADEVFAAARDLPGGHPAWGGATLAALQLQSEAAKDMKTLLVEILEAANVSQERVEEVKGAEDTYHALIVLDDRGLKGEAEKSVRDALREAIAAVEAAVRLVAVRQRQETLWQSFHGSLEAIRAAHGEHCVCGS